MSKNPPEPQRSAKRPAGTRRRTPRPLSPPAAPKATTRRPRRRTRGQIKLATGPFRLWSALCVIGFVMSLFAARLIQLQGIDESDYARLAAEKGAQTIALEAPRAPIYDRNGVRLAETIDASKLIADPTFTKTRATEIAALLTHRLGLDYLTLVNDLRTPKTRYVELAQDLPPAQATAIVARLDHLGFGGVYTEHDTQRTYPDGDIASNLLGFVNANGDGTFGVEQTLNSQLQGHNGKATYQVEGGQILPLANSTVVEPKEGTGVKLTIDQDLQFLAQRRVEAAVKSSQADSGVAVVLDARTSQVLALADYPSFDSNDFTTANPKDFGSRALQEPYEPGSVEKLLTFSALIDAGYVTPTTQIDEPQILPVGGHFIHDDFTHVDANYQPTDHYHLTAAGVIAQSSNIGAVLAAKKMPNDQLYGYLKKFGIGSPMSIGLPAVSSGLLAPTSTWSDIQRANIDFGQGVSVNALQMAAAVAAIAHGGVYTSPSLVEGNVSSDGHYTPAAAPQSHRVISAAAAKAVTSMMEDVVYAPGGTGPLAAIPGYRVAGKTGTAQRAAPNGGGYTNERTVSFAGFAPADNPRILVYVVVQNPRAANSFGGTVAAPVVHDLLTSALLKYGIPPTPGQPGHLPPTTW